jgi:branched-chain amino acid transport system permease protein
MLAAGAIVALMPLVISDYRAFQLTYVGVYFIAIVGLNVVTGFSGQISLGQGGFMAIGAYTTAIMAVNYGVDEYWTIPAAGLITGAIGFAFGFPALRLGGHYLALATFALDIAIVSIARRFDHLTGGTPGKVLRLPSSPIGGLSAEVWLYYLTWAIAIVLFGIVWLLLRGRVGLALRALRDAPIAATAFGVSLAKFKTFAFAIAAFYAGIAGALFAIAVAYVNPDTFPVSLSILLLTGAVVGGLGSLGGMLIGALFIEYVPLWAQDASKSASAVFYGVTLIVVLLVLPQGAAGLGGTLRRSWKRVSRHVDGRVVSREPR